MRFADITHNYYSRTVREIFAGESIAFHLFAIRAQYNIIIIITFVVWYDLCSEVVVTIFHMYRVPIQ